MELERQEQLKKLYELLLSHDWTYVFSDDIHVFDRGSREHKELVSLIGSDNTFQSLYDLFVNWKFHGGKKPELPI